MEHRIYNTKTIFLALSTFVFLVLADQISKYIIRHGGGFYICNPDVAFGVKIPSAIFWLSWIIIVMAVFLALLKSLKNVQLITFHSQLSILASILILAGALANMLDRITLGCVVDFIDWRIWPVFNLADFFIVSGAILSLVRMKKI